jgi:hypothetical protein
VGVALVATLGILGAVPATGLPGVAADAADPPPLRVVGDARYIIEPDKSRVRVNVALTIANTLGETVTHRYWYDRAYLAVQPGASAIRVSGAGLVPSVRVTRTASDHRLIEIVFGKRLYSGQSLALALSFNLRDPGGAPDRPIRVGNGLVSFPVWAFASDATSGARASVVVPAGFEIQYGAGAFADHAQLDGGAVELASGLLTDATKLRAYLVATGEAAFVASRSAVPVAGGELGVTVRGWSDDVAWRHRMAAVVKEAATVIAADTGLSGPGAGLVVEEVTPWALGGGSVVLDPTVGRLLVAHDAAKPAVIRGLAQAFLTADVVAERWAIEGLAEVYAERAATAMDVALEAPAWSPDLLPLGGPLNAWTGSAARPTAADVAARTNAVELGRRLIERVGPDGARAALARLAAGVSTYQPAGTPTAGPEKADGPADWRRIVDSFEAEADADLGDLWVQFVVRPQEASLLAARRAARARYEASLSSSAGWALPAAIREAMTNWRFESAQALFDEIDDAMAQRASLEVAAAKLGLRLPDQVQPLFERGRFDAALAESDAEAAAIEAIAAAVDASAPVGPFGVVGLLGEEPMSDLATARAAFEDGRLDDSVAAASIARATWLAAEDVGRGRLALVAVLIGALGVAVLVVRARRARTRAVVRRRMGRASPR